MQNSYSFFILLFLTSSISLGQGSKTYKLHSHNDYLQTVPFWVAFANQVESIEADVILMNDELYVAHEKESIKKDRTLTTLYLDPIRKAFELKIGGAKSFQLLIDIKTEPYTTLEKLKEELASYQDLFTGAQGTPKMEIVISGNRPAPNDYHNYPEYMQFDYQSITETTELPLEKIALISLNFKNLSGWNGKGRIIDSEQEALKNAIDVAHSLGKPIRFWASPDSKTAWKALKELKVDIINTDQPFEAKAYLKTLDERIYARPQAGNIYQPDFKIDGLHQPIKNVILLIGDGNGLAQISAALFANNNQLTLATLKNMGLIKTQSADDFTTDSAAAGTALATGNKVKNRNIGIRPDGNQVQNIPEYLQQFLYLTGIVTNDHITGATPAAFYAHQSDRDMTGQILRDLSQSPLNLFIGADNEEIGIEERMEEFSKSGFSLCNSLLDIGPSTRNKVGFFASSEDFSPEGQRINFLSTATAQAITFLSNKGKPFFLMVEGAKIDSGGHLNHSETVIEEGIGFDLAIGEALKFADKNRETLVIITADHETGGVTIPHGNREKGEVELEFGTNDHTGVLIPLFAYGPHSDEFRGIYENTEVFQKIIALIKKYKK